MRYLLAVVMLVSTSFGQATFNKSGSGNATFLQPLSSFLVLSPSNASFADTNVGSTSSATVTLSNPNSTDVTVSKISILAGLQSADFTITGGTCAPGTLSAGSGCTIVTQFAPSAGGTRTAILEVDSNADISPVTANLTGRGVAPSVPAATVTPASISFPDTTTGTTSATSTVTVQSSGSTTLDIASIASSDSTNFPLSSNTCGSTLASGSSCTVQVACSPSVAGAHNAEVDVTDNDQGIAGSVQRVGLVCNGVAPSALSIITSALPNGTQNVTYSTQLSASGGTPPYTWAISVGSLPTGLSLTASTGVISGTPSGTGTSSFTAQVTDSAAGTDSKALSITINAQQTSGADNRYCSSSDTWTGGVSDGPAALPTRCINTALANTPANSGTVSVIAGNFNDLQSKITQATCGQTIIVPLGTYTGHLVIPATHCDSAHWIWVRSQQINSASFPTEGTRATSCDAGVTLPNRPANDGGTCSDSTVVLPKLVGTGSVETILGSDGGGYWRFTGFEVQKNPTTTGYCNGVINTGAFDHLIFDRVWVHGTPNEDLRWGIRAQAGAVYIAVVDSSFTDIHAIYNGGSTHCGGGDTYVFGFGLGDSSFNSNLKGPFKFVNNYMEAAGNTGWAGGGGNAGVNMPADGEFRRNLITKPLFWNQVCVAPLPAQCNGQTNNGEIYATKNNGEWKAGVRFLVEGNVFLNGWAHADQQAQAFLITPKNQSAQLPDGTFTGQCPQCVTKDITVRFNYISGTNGLGTSNASGDHGVGNAKEGSNYSLHDNVIDNLLTNICSNPGDQCTPFYVVKMVAPLNLTATDTFNLHDIWFNHNTVMQATSNFTGLDSMILLDGPTSQKMGNMSWSNNIVPYGSFGVEHSGTGGCNGSSGTNFTAKFDSCWTAGYSFTTNAIIGGKGTWPNSNFFPANAAAMNFTNLNGGIGGDYHLTASSPGFHAASDSSARTAAGLSTDIGADIDAVNTAISGVQ